MKYIIFLALFLLPFTSFLQSLNYRVVGKITNSDTRKNESGVTISFMRGSSTLGSVVTSSNGKYD